MNRVKENETGLKIIQRELENNPKASFKQIVMAHVGAGIGILADISRSLAVIADALTEERNKNHE